MTEPQQTLLQNARLLDGTGADPLTGIDVLIEGERIVAVGAAARPRAGAALLDLGGRTLLPGLIDCHVHITLAGDGDEAVRLPSIPTPVIAWTAAENARRTVEAGVTTARDLGAPASVAIHLRDQILAGRLPGPRLRAAGAAICMTGGHGHWVGREADGPDDVRKAVREQLRAGADCIKLIATGGVMTPGVDPRSPQFTEEEMRAGVEEAHKAFRVVGAHAQATEGIKNAVRAGVDSIEHGIYLDDEAVALMRERGTVLVPTLIAPVQISRHGIAAGVPAFMVEKSDRVQGVHRESFTRALHAGVRIAMGTDAGTPFNRHGANAEELALMVAAGMTPAQALVAATRTAAELLGLAEQTGTLAPGKQADLLVVEGDPLSEIAVLSSGVVGVMRAGSWVRRSPALATA